MIQQTRILIIEDEAPIRKFLRISLESEGYDITETATAAAGVDATKAKTFDLIVLDLGLPDKDGQAVITALRQSLATPIIVLSVRATENEKIRALDAGANDYVTKPFAIGEFLARVRVLMRLNQSQQQSADLIQVADLEVNVNLREVSRHQQPIHLSRKEFDLLHMLVINPGRLITHQQLLSNIWGDAFVSETHYLRVLVGHLRQKLGDDPMHPRYITTVQGVGYRFSD
jgi:two-component system KDP operon response regulator KdpE